MSESEEQRKRREASGQPNVSYLSDSEFKVPGFGCDLRNTREYKKELRKRGSALACDFLRDVQKSGGEVSVEEARAVLLKILRRR